MWWLGWFAPKISVPASASSKIDDVLAEDGGLLHVLTLAVHLKFFLDGQVGATPKLFVSAPVPFWPFGPFRGWNWVGLGWDWVWGDSGVGD